MRFGFRRVEVKDGLLLLNGKPLTLKGVTYGVRQTVYPADRDRIRHDLLAMKRCNINAVRTARYSPMDPFFYQLCDELGLYVVCDANLLPASTQQRAVAVDKEFIPLFEHRVENLYGKYKNHPSIIAWSLGEGRDNGICMAAAYKRLKSIEKSRPVVFSGAEFSDNSDVIALMNPSPQALRQALAKSSNRPFLLLSAVKDGNFAGLEDLWDLVEGHRNLQGGFVDIWPLSEARQSDLKNLFSPFDIQLSKTTIDDASFLVFNRNDFSDFSGYILEYTVFTNHRTGITAGDLPVAIAPGGVEEVGLRIPPVALQPGEELMVRFDLERRNAPLAQRLLGTKVFELPDKNLTKRPLVNNGRLDAGSCDLSLCPGLRFGGHDDWTKEVVASSQRSPDSGIVCVDAMLRFSAAGRSMCDVRVTSTFFASGDVVVDYTLAPTDAVRGDLVPLLDVALPGQGTDTLLWFGLDREVCFARRGSGILGNYSMPRNKMYNTSRRQVRWCADRQSGGNLYVALIGEPFSVDIDTAGLTLHPVTGSASFRVHLRRFGPGDSPDDFYSTELPVVKTGILDPPIITASAPRFSQPLAVTIVLPSGHSASLPSIRYTLDGSEPDESSPLYAAPIELTTTTVVKARAYAPGIPPSFTATRKFNYDYIVKTSFSQKPNTPFNVGTDTLLFDGEHGTADDLSYGWLGFSGDGVTTTVELSKPVDIETVTLRFAHSPAMWAFAPRQVTLLLSEDGQAFSDTLSAALPFDPASADFDSPQVVELKVPVDRKGVTFLKVVARSIGALPQWHRAKGLKPWLLMDEIEVAETPKSRNNKIMQ